MWQMLNASARRLSACSVSIPHRIVREGRADLYIILLKEEENTFIVLEGDLLGLGKLVQLRHLALVCVQVLEDRS